MPIGEWYHCYSRGVDKRVVFQTRADYERFLVHMYIANNSKNRRVSDIRNPQLSAVLANKILEGDPIVEVAAYSLMPTHVHFVLHQIREGGIATFMQRLFTGYTMYFNNKNDRTGALFSGSFKSKHIADDTYLKLAIPYVLLNPAELYEKNWKRGIGNIRSLEKKLLAYPYSSLPAFCGIEGAQVKISQNILNEYYDKRPTLREMIKDAKEYYRQVNPH
jgi:putative transposase